jgi:hypothetical protein
MDEVDQFKEKQKMIKEHQNDLKFLITFLDYFRLWIPKAVSYYSKRELYIRVSIPQFFHF